MPIKSSTHSVFNTLGASNHTEEERSKNDFYATPPLAVRKLLQLEQFDENIWEPACGMNHITNVLRQHGYKVRTSDIVNMTGEPDIELLDIFTYNGTFDGDIISNPPYSLGKEFTEKCLEIVPEGHKVAMFLKLQFLESKKRYDLFKNTHQRSSTFQLTDLVVPKQDSSMKTIIAVRPSAIVGTSGRKVILGIPSLSGFDIKLK